MTVAETARTVADMKTSAENLGAWLVPVLFVAVVALCGYIVGAREAAPGGWPDAVPQTARHRARLVWAALLAAAPLANCNTLRQRDAARLEVAGLNLAIQKQKTEAQANSWPPKPARC